MFRLRKHRAKLKLMLINLGIFKLKCPDQDRLGHECSQNCNHTTDIVYKDEAIEENWRSTPQFDLSTCKNGTTQCLIPIKCADAGRCPYGK